ncbi:ankyrin repeat domain-containing protein, partial [bacterium]
MTDPIFDAILGSDLDTVIRLARAPEHREARTSLSDLYGPFWESMTPLMVAAAAPGEKAATVRALLDAGADLAARSEGGASAAFFAAGAGDYWVIDDAHGNSLQGPALAGDYAERLRMLLEAGADPQEVAPNGRNLPGEAARAGDPIRLRMLLEVGASPHLTEATSEPRGMEGISARRPRNPFGHVWLHFPLANAAAGGSAECVRLLLQAGASIAEIDDDGKNALAHATSAEVAEALIHAGLDPDDESLWHQAIWEDKPEIAALLLEKGADPEFLLDTTPLIYMAAYAGATEIVHLLDRHGADLGRLRQYGDSALHAAVSGMGPEPEKQEELVRFFLARGLDIEGRDERAETPLHKAAAREHGHAEAIEMLLKLGAHPDPVNEAGDTPLIFAAESECEACVALLLAAGADPDRPGQQGLSARQFAKRWH